MSANKIADRGTSKEVLLLEAQLLACLGVVVRIKYGGDVLCLLACLNRLEVVALVE